MEERGVRSFAVQYDRPPRAGSISRARPRRRRPRSIADSLTLPLARGTQQTEQAAVLLRYFGWKKEKLVEVSFSSSPPASSLTRPLPSSI